MANLSSQARIALNVRVVVGKPTETGIDIRLDKKFKNTATKLMTESICNYLAGAENTYKRGKGRPNYMGLGTMGITKQPFGSSDKAEVMPDFSDKNYDGSQTTRPWFESTSIALSNLCGATNVDSDGNNLHFWDPSKGWGKDGFTGAVSSDPVFQGELCTALNHSQDDPSHIYDDIERIPILRADVLSDCPADWDYGVDGYSSQVIFYSYASVGWIHKIMKPYYAIKVPSTGKELRMPVGPQLDVMAISEFGLYEKNNTDPHGLDTMLAGFRVPSPEDIIYVNDGEVILIEWRVSVRAIMPNELVTTPDAATLGISIAGNVVDSHHIQFTAEIPGTGELAPDISWSISGNTASNTAIDSSGRLTISSQETAHQLTIIAQSNLIPQMQTSTVVFLDWS